MGKMDADYKDVFKESFQIKLCQNLWIKGYPREKLYYFEVFFSIEI
jgi:hypothetical protein